MAKTPPTAQNDTKGEADSQGEVGKGRPTPTRKEKEAARKRPLVSNDRKEARKRSREQMAVRRERARVGMANGEEKYLPMRDRGPQKKFVRDYIDARFSIGELLIPVMLGVLLFGLVQDLQVQLVSTIVLYVFFILTVADSLVLGQILTRKLQKRFGEDKVEKVRFYAAMRAVQWRGMRMPKAQVKRGQYPA